jgi:hypothetical protein
MSIHITIIGNLVGVNDFAHSVLTKVVGNHIVDGNKILTPFALSLLEHLTSALNPVFLLMEYQQ